MGIRSSVGATLLNRKGAKGAKSCANGAICGLPVPIVRDHRRGISPSMMPFAPPFASFAPSRFSTADLRDPDPATLLADSGR
jgi:hypothetical protein